MKPTFRRVAAWLAACAAALSTLSAGATIPIDDPCARYRALGGNLTAEVSDSAPGSGPLRVFAMQHKQLVDYVETYETYAAKMDCMMRDYVAPHLDRSKTNLIVFNEDIGLITLGTGSRGAQARALAASPMPGSTPETLDATGAPLGGAAALGSVAATYQRQMLDVERRFPGTDPRKAILLAATDTFVRGFSATFSRLARTYGVWMVSSNNQGEFDYSTDPVDVATWADPDLAADYAAGRIKGVFVPRSEKVWNNAFLWAPYDLRPPKPGASADPASPDYDPDTNLLFTNRKTPLTEIEKAFFALDEGDMSVSNTGPVEIPGLAGFKLGFAISLPAFRFGNDFGEPFFGDPCASANSWMRCLHERGVNTIIQPEANPGPWARYGADGGNFQSLTWGASTLRMVTDPTVPNFRYVVCPHMTGNLIDLPFDGQSAILERGRTGTARAYVGAKDFIPETDSAWTMPYAGLKPEFLALAAWVIDDDHSLSPIENRRRLHNRASELMAGSRSEHSNAYLETAIFADLATP
ncbi:MAG TPA: hypothetical protein VM841_02005 [Actinomycetota bacterium]|nr:hypothetical protein [Actinomycetota bacterium]